MLCAWLQSNYEKKDVEYKYVPIFSFPKKEDLRNKWKGKIPLENLVVTQNSKVDKLKFKHFEVQDLWKYDVFPCSNGDPDIIVSETIRFNELQLLRLSLWSKGFTIKMYCSNTTSIQIVS